MYYRTCDSCGAHLDPGEKCDCEEVLQRKLDKLTEKYKALTVRDEDNQLKMVV